MTCSPHSPVVFKAVAEESERGRGKKKENVPLRHPPHSRSTSAAPPPPPTPQAISQPPVSSSATPKFPLPLPPHQLCAVDAFQRLDSAARRCGSVRWRAAFHRRCLGRGDSEREREGGREEGPRLFSWTLCVATVLPLDTHPRENSPFKSERHLLQPPCVFCFFVFCSLFCSSVWESGRESVGEKAHGSGRAWRSVSLVRLIYLLHFFYFLHLSCETSGG